MSAVYNVYSAYSVYSAENCTICPRKCGADRTKTKGYCGTTDTLLVAKACLHFGEEPCVSGKNGSGTVFFSGCSLKCCFCQNTPISRQKNLVGKETTINQLADIFLDLQAQNAHNINLVNPTHFVPQIAQALDIVKGKLKIPVVYNSGGYDCVDSLKMLDGLVDVYLPDFKYLDKAIAKKYSAAENYPDFVIPAIQEMQRQAPVTLFDENGIIQKGLIIRHLILPNQYKDSLKIMDAIAENFHKDNLLVSIMRQYTPCYDAQKYPEINRKLTTFEYEKVISRACDLNIQGFSQKKSSSTLEMTPDFLTE